MKGRHSEAEGRGKSGDNEKGGTVKILGQCTGFDIVQQEHHTRRSFINPDVCAEHRQGYQINPCMHRTLMSHMDSSCSMGSSGLFAK